MIHELKILPEYFEGVVSGKKTFEVRKNDRTFQVGDMLALNEYNMGYTGNSCLVYVDYILADPEFVKEDMVVMSIKPCSVYRHATPYDQWKCEKDYSVPLATKAE